MDNVLYYGDNLDILRRYIKDETVDLVYLDPPFNSNATYNVLFADKSGAKAASQLKAFKDTWEWEEAAKTYQETVEAGGQVSETLQAFHKLLRTSDLMAYLSMMAPRLVELRRVMKETATIYLHCDPTASHYLKLLMDSVFGPERFKNEVVWRRYGVHNDVGQGSQHFGRVHDVLLVYDKGSIPTWNQVFVPLNAAYVKDTYRLAEPETGRRFMTTPLTGPGGAEKGNPVFEWKGHTRAWRYNRETMERLDKEGRLYYSGTGYARQKKYLDESKGVPVQDWWEDIPALSGAHAERLGYPTQKPEALLERILQASSKPNDVVLDPFCGCGTAIAVAKKLNRQWVGIDITQAAIVVIKERLGDAQYKIVGEPVSVPDAQALADQNKYQFQWWALGLVGARPAESDQKKGADRGIDGRLYFIDDPSGETTSQVVFSIKAGKTIDVSMVRDLAHVVSREKAQIGVLISMVQPTQPMRKEAAEMGFYHSPLWDKDFQRLQLRTVDELMSGKGIEMPPKQQVNITFKKAPKARAKKADTLPMALGDGD